MLLFILETASVDPKAFGRQQGSHSPLQDQADKRVPTLCVPLNLDITPAGRAIVDAVGGFDAKHREVIICPLNEQSTRARTTMAEVVTIMYCQDNELNQHPWIAVHIFPEKATRLVRIGEYSQVTNWVKKEGEQVPAVIMCIGWNFDKKLLAKDRHRRENGKSRWRKEVVAAAGSKRWMTVKRGGGAGISYDENTPSAELSGLYWSLPKGSAGNGPGYENNEWPLLFGYNGEPWGRGDCSQFGIQMDVKIRGCDSRKHCPASYEGCPLVYAPWGLMSFGYRGFHRLEDLIIPAPQDPAGGVARWRGESEAHRTASRAAGTAAATLHAGKKKRRFAAFMHNNCGYFSRSNVRVSSE
jgi:hypothetical protein